MVRLKTHRKTPLQRFGKTEKRPMESFLKDFLAILTEASYQLVVRCGFQGSFIRFLSDFQETVENVIEQKNSVVFLRKGQEPRTAHYQEMKKNFKGWDQYE